MSNEAVMFGAGGAVVGLMVGLLIGGGSDDIETSLKRSIDSQAEATAAMVDEKMAALDARLDGIEQAVATASEAQAGLGDTVAGQIDGAVATLSGKVDGVAESLTERVTEGVTQAVSEAGAAQSASLQEALSSQMDGLSDTLGTAMTAVTALAAAPAATAGTGAVANAAATQPVEDAAATPEPEPEEIIEGIRVGQTEQFLDGKIRVFVSGITDDGAARVAINGLDTQLIRARRPAMFEIDEIPCQVALDAIVKGHVQVTGSCDE